MLSVFSKQFCVAGGREAAMKSERRMKVVSQTALKAIVKNGSFSDEIRTLWRI